MMRYIPLLTRAYQKNQTNKYLIVYKSCILDTFLLLPISKSSVNLKRLARCSIYSSEVLPNIGQASVSHQSFIILNTSD